MPASDQRSQTSPLSIKLRGSLLQPAELGQVVDVTVEQDLFLPDALTIRIRDVSDDPTQAEQGYCKLLDQDRFAVGAEIEIGVGREASPQTLLKGEVTSIELDLQLDGPPILTIRGYDRSHRLHRERKSRTFLNTKDSDLASRVAADHGLTARTDTTSVVHEHVFQDNQTDWEFLRARASRVGYELFVEDRALHFRQPTTSQSAPAQEFGKTLQKLRMRMSTSPQVGQVMVKGWDPATKRAVVGTANQATNSVQIGGKTGAQLAQSAFSQAGKFVLVEQPVSNQSDANTLAKALYDQIAGDFLQLEGVCLGEPGIRPGRTIALSKVSTRLDGSYYISAATHRLTAREGYLTQFTVNGRRPASLGALLTTAGAGERRSGGSAGHPGVVIGLVTNNKDPDNHGRVKVKFPWLADQEESNWAPMASPMAGGNRGFFWLPEVNDEVLVAFEHGDINRPYVVGALWNGRDAPPLQASQAVGATGTVDERVIKSRLGHIVRLDDSTDSPSITITDKTGNNTIKFDSTTNEISVKAQTTVKIEATNLKLEATGQVTLKGANVQVESTGPLNVKGAMSTLEASGITTVKGSLVKIN